MTDPQVPPPRSTTDEVVEAVIQKAANKVAEATTASTNGHSALGRSEAIAAIAALIILNFAVLFLSIEGRSQRNDIQQDVRALCRVTSTLIQPEGQQMDPTTQSQRVNLLAILTECLD